MQILSFMGEVMTLNQWLVAAMFLGFIYLLFRGIPVAFCLVGISLIFIVLGEFVLDPNRKLINEYIEYDRVGLAYQKLFANGGRFFGGTIKNPVLVALPMFIFMGLMLDQSGVAQRMMRSMQVLFGALRGGLALSVMLIGIILAASTGVIGASVVLLGVMGIPTMMGQNYSKPIATGTIAASGTLGILIPPSIMLVIMSDQLAISLGDLFMGALFPGLMLGCLYIAFLIIYGLINPSAMPLPENREPVSMKVVMDVLISVLPPMGLIILVLGSIFYGLATPTEASGLGAAGATLLALFSRNLNFTVFKDVMRQTLNTSGYIVGIFITAAFFAYVLRRYGGDEIIENLVLGSFDNPYMVVAFILFIIFCLGFLLDWIEITLIIMPLMLPVVLALNIPVDGYGVVSDPSIVWFAILVAVTLQTSFLTPPVGFALFYLKGVCPPEISLGHIYRGVIPFVLLQLTGLGIVFAFPALTTWLPAVAYGTN
ncbi:MAG: TRAP transporter large permease subunit [Silicimonas sp.]|nr:TRAP transporter large permease subunit [Silicimonas sp.]